MRPPVATLTRHASGSPSFSRGALGRVLLLLTVLAGCATTGSAQSNQPPTGLSGYEQRIGEQLPGDIVLADQDGVSRPISTYFGLRPLVVVFGYHKCAQLCSIVSDAAINSLRQVRRGPETQFEFLYVSIDPAETPADAAEARARDLRRYDRPEAAAHWHYLTGPERDVRRLAGAAGFHYVPLPEEQQFAHPSGFLVATKDGVISKYFLGVEFQPRDIASALRRASEGKTGESVFNLVLTCVRGGKLTGRYGPLIWRVLQVAVFSTVIALAWGIIHLLRAEFRERRRASTP